MYLASHCKRRIAQRVGIKNDRKAQSWANRHINKGVWFRARGERHIVVDGRFVFIVSGRWIISFWIVKPEHEWTVINGTFLQHPRKEIANVG